jgi:PEP-CTERM motif-containing protein
MKNVKAVVLCAALGASLLLSASAKANTIVENLTFNLTGFVDIGGSNIPAPDPLVTGSITVTYDPTLAYDNDTTDIVVHSLNGVTVSSPLGFTYQNGLLEFGGTQSDSDFVDANTNDIVVAFNVSNPADPTFIPCSTPGYTCGVDTGSPLVDAAGYTIAGYNTGWFYGVKSTVSPTLPPPTSTPEPSTVGLLGIGLAALAFATRRLAVS